MDIDFPYRIAVNGRTASTNRSEHIRDMIKQVLFTSPGERVNRPTFGSGLNQLVFEPNNIELLSTVQFLVKGSLQEWLGDVIEVGEVHIEVLDASLSINIHYQEIGTGQEQEVTFQQSI